MRPGKALLGLLVGAVLGAMFQALDGGVEPALVAAAVALTYRVIAAIVYRGRELVRVMAEEVPASELRYVVPFEARSRYVGGDYVEQLARARGGTFAETHRTSESSPRSTAWKARPSTQAGCTR